MKTCKMCGILKPIEEFYSQEKHSKKKGDWVYYHPECKECTIKRSSKYNQEHPEALKAADLKRNGSKERQQYLLDLSNKRRENGKYREWQRTNPDRHKIYRFNRIHKEHDISNDEWFSCKEYFDFECAYCGLDINDHIIRRLDNYFNSDFHREHVDHKGANDITNCVPSCLSCNSSKRQKSLEEWYNPLNNRFSSDRLEKIHNWLNSDFKRYLDKNRLKNEDFKYEGDKN